MAKTQYDYSVRLRQELHRKIRRVVFFIVAVLVFLAFFLRLILFSVSLRTTAMEPNTAYGARLFVSPLFSVEPRLPFFALERGNTVLAHLHEQNEMPFYKNILNRALSFITFQQISLETLASRAGNSIVISRVIGFPGDTIYLSDYVMYVKPEGEFLFLSEFELTQSDYEIKVDFLPADWDESIGIVGRFSEITLKDDEYFLLCDNRASSADSRLWGVVQGRQILGRALFKYFPLASVSFL
jgi:signal peptidase I